MRHQRSDPAARRDPSASAPVLFIHGATFPSGLAVGYRFDGVSWMTDLASRGYDAWALDFIGFGGSDRYPEMREPQYSHAPLGRAPESARQIAAAVVFITERTRAPRVSLIAHSWGTIPTALYAGNNPERVDHLVLFGAIAQRNELADTTTLPAYDFVTIRDQHNRFTGYVPPGERQVLSVRHFAEWGPAYMATDPTSGTRNPASVEIPTGSAADINDAWSGHLAYDPSRITAPVLIIRGEWDIVTKDADARWLYDALTHAPIKRDVKISRGTHVMHLEESRSQLYGEVAEFLGEPDTRVHASAASALGSADQNVRPIHVAGFGALTGPVRSFGINSRAALNAAADSINRAGGVRLSNGARGRFVVSYDDDHCQPSEGIALVRQYAASDALVAVGPSCSGVAEPLYHLLRQTVVGGSEALADIGIAIPVFTDGATKANLAHLSPWAFRNAPNETAMYPALWAWVAHHYPNARTIAAAEEADFAHSHSTWDNIIRPSAVATGFMLIGTVPLSINDTSFADAARQIAVMNADIVVLSAHSVGTCGMLRELHRLNVHPKLIVGLTSTSSSQTLALCGNDAEGLLIPTSFARDGRAATAAAAAVERAGGIADLHSMAAWEIMFTLKQAIEQSGVVGTAVTLTADRQRLRDQLARLTTMDGLMGPISRTADRESLKPFVLVQAQAGKWRIVEDGRDSTH